MRSARWIFAVAAIYGLIVLLPLYGLEQVIARDAPPAITHPEYFYGFIGVAVVMQLVYALIATDPPRYRPAMLLAALGKLVFAASTGMLWLLGRVAPAPTALSGVDFCLGVLFCLAFWWTPPPARAESG